MSTSYKVNIKMLLVKHSVLSTTSVRVGLTGPESNLFEKCACVKLVVALLTETSIVSILQLKALATYLDPCWNKFEDYSLTSNEIPDLRNETGRQKYMKENI